MSSRRLQAAPLQRHRRHYWSITRTILCTTTAIPTPYATSTPTSPLPLYPPPLLPRRDEHVCRGAGAVINARHLQLLQRHRRSEERRVGKDSTTTTSFYI